VLRRHISAGKRALKEMWIKEETAKSFECVVEQSKTVMNKTGDKADEETRGT
jgi:hypothetical protein